MTTTTAPLRIDAAGAAQNADPLPAGDLASVASLRECVLEPKMDGWRLLAHVHEDGVSLYSRKGKSYTGRLPHVEAELLARFPAGTWIDGEAVAFGIDKDTGNVVQHWGVAQSVLTTHGYHAEREAITYVVFDLLAHGGLDARPLPLRKRRELLETIFAKPFASLHLSVQMEPTEANHDRIVASGFEGSMLKALDVPYASGRRGRGWWKLKPQLTMDAIIVGFKPGENGFAGLIGAIEFAQYDADGVLRHRGRCSGMDFRTRVWMTENAERLAAERTVIELKYFCVLDPTDEYPLGALRSPQFKRLRDDKTPEECVVQNGERTDA